MTSRSSSDDDSGSFPLLCLQTPSTPHQSKSMSSARETLSFTEEGKKHDVRCTTAVLWKLKLSSWFSCFSCASRAFVSCLQGLRFFLAVLFLPQYCQNGKSTQLIFTFHQSFQVGIFGPPDTLYQGGYFKVSSISATAVILSHRMWQVCSLTNNSSENGIVL